MQKLDVVIVGAGFAGLACARVLGQAGYQVVVLERKPDSGARLGTTGLLVPELLEAFPIPCHLYRRIPRLRLYAPNLRSMEIGAPDYFYAATDTAGLLRYFADKATKAGAVIRYGHRFRQGESRGERILLPDLRFNCRYLVGADGAHSDVARCFALPSPKRFLVGLEAEFLGADLSNGEIINCFLSRRHAPGYIGWAFPGLGITQVGLAALQPHRPDLGRFLDHIRPVVELDESRIIGHRAGLIPVSGPVRPLSRDNVILLGDAAGQVSPLSAGGIHYALHQGEKLGNLLSQALSGRRSAPGARFARQAPRFRRKRLARRSFERFFSDRLANACIGGPVMRVLAHWVFLLRKHLS